jgi:hypothetical protein
MHIPFTQVAVDVVIGFTLSYPMLMLHFITTVISLIDGVRTHSEVHSYHGTHRRAGIDHGEENMHSLRTPQQGHEEGVVLHQDQGE